MQYQKITITTSPEKLELLTDLLADFAIDAVEIVDPREVDYIIENQDKLAWNYIDETILSEDRNTPPKVVFYLSEEQMPLLPDRLDAMVTKEILVLHSLQDVARYVQAEEISDTDWQENYKLTFTTRPLTDHLVIVPSWEKDTYDPAAWPGMKPIFLDPGMAFGTGEHATTSLCARLMDEYGCEGKKVLDMGTGSGILAMGAVLLGAEEALGVEIDPEAAKIAKENVERNGLEGSVAIREGDLTDGLTYEADIALGNLVAGLVVRLGETLPDYLVPGGLYISSGILTDQAEDVKEKLTALGFEWEATRTEGEWCALVMRKR